MNHKIKVVVVDDHEALRKGLCLLLSQYPSIDVVAEASNGEHAYEVIGLSTPDVIVMDLNMPGMGGLEALGHIMARWPFLKVVVFSMHEEAAFVIKSIAAGAYGYVTKSDDTDELFQAIRSAAFGQRYISHSVAPKVAIHALAEEQNTLTSLSPREFEIFRMLAEGNSVEKIASLLKLSPKTIANHQTILKQKLGVKSSLELIRMAIKFEIING
jgi:DNA-binding NarL/FixJ family response regulator